VTAPREPIFDRSASRVNAAPDDALSGAPERWTSMMDESIAGKSATREVHDGNFGTHCDSLRPWVGLLVVVLPVGFLEYGGFTK
jgi:hypothetical protein